MTIGINVSGEPDVDARATAFRHPHDQCVHRVRTAPTSVARR